MRKYSGKEVTRAGEVLIKENIAETDYAAYEQAMDALSFWRACHEAPLTQAAKLLAEAAKKHDEKAVIAKRLKRTPSIVNKLRRFKGMTLRSMQDIGGCRAILANEKRVRKLVRELKRKKDFRIKDYITQMSERLHHRRRVSDRHHAGDGHDQCDQRGGDPVGDDFHLHKSLMFVASAIFSLKPGWLVIIKVV
jgi:hypothetical protein